LLGSGGNPARSRDAIGGSMAPGFVEHRLVGIDPDDVTELRGQFNRENAGTTPDVDESPRSVEAAFGAQH